MPSRPLLVSTWYSPWSERVRWVIDHHRLDVARTEHVPFLGERRLRRLAGNPPGRVSVPLLVDGDTVLRESWDIARWADARGGASKLIPADRVDDVHRWVTIADESCEAGRAHVTAGLAGDPKAIDETLPPSFPSWLRPLLRPVGAYAMRWFARKYDVDAEGAESRLRRLRAGLDALRSGLSSGSGYLLGTFSYADIAAATALQGIAPVEDSYIRLGPATRQAWSWPELASEYVELVGWRDALYQRHRRE